MSDGAARARELCDALIGTVGADVVVQVLSVAAMLNPATRGLVAKVPCPACGSSDTRCRQGNTNLADGRVRRHKECSACNAKFSTITAGEGEVVEARSAVGSQKSA